MSGVNEFLPRPPWRRRVGTGPRGLAITLTFALAIALGAAVLMLALLVVRKLDAPSWVQVMVWVVPTVATTGWSTRSRTPATKSDSDAQGWGEYVARFVMVGNETVRSIPLRVITGVLFGAPLAFYLVVLVVLAAAGIV